MKIINESTEKELTGYPSIDKPWLKYYSEEALNTPLPECTVYELLWEKNKDHLDDIALMYFGKKISYRRLFESINKVANSFMALGVKKGDIVAMCVTNTPEMVYCFYALNKIGAIANMLDLRLSPSEFRDVINEQKNSYVVLLDTCLKNMREAITDTEVKQAVVMTPLQSWGISFCNKANFKGQFIGYKEFIKLGTDGVAMQEMHCKPDDIAVIAHTGGTTGVPKGVQISNRSMVCVAVEYMVSGMPMKRGEKFLCLVPPFILNGLCTCLNLPLTAGVAVNLVPQFIQKKFPQYLKNKPEHVIAAPSWWERLSHDSKMKNVDLSFLITAATGGDGINPESEKAMNAFFHMHNASYNILNGYGMTETGSSVCTNMQNRSMAGSIGIPLPYMTLAVFDEKCDELPYGKQGELCVKGPSIMNGYCGRAVSENASTLKQHKDGTLWVHTGDMAHVTEDGFVYVDGRIKRIIIREGGFKVFPNLIEEVLMKVPGVDYCAVVGKRVSKNLTGQIPVAFIVSSIHQDVLEKECLLRCKENLASHCIPEHFYFLPDIPLTPMGKIDYRTLEEMAAAGEKE